MIIDATGTYCISNIRYLRKKYCVSRRGLARLAGIAECRLRDMESGIIRAELSNEVLRRVCAVFDLKTEQLLHCNLPAGELIPPPSPFPGDPAGMQE